MDNISTNEAFVSHLHVKKKKTLADLIQLGRVCRPILTRHIDVEEFATLLFNAFQKYRNLKRTRGTS